MCVSTSDKERVIKNISIVLVSPQVPENIGLCARVLKNTSFFNLLLVNPNLNGKSFEVSKRARDILEKAKICKSLKEAVRDSHFVFGTTRRKREYASVYNFGGILPMLAASARKKKISIVFGREDFGLSKEEMEYCDSAFYIPADQKFASYNLAFSVGIVCYKIFEYLENISSISSLSLAKNKDIEALYINIENVLKKLKFKSNITSGSLSTIRRIFKRTHLTRNEIKLLKSIFLAAGKKA